MTKAKKVLSLVLAVVMVAAMFAFSASAATQNATFTVSVDNATVSQNDVITVTVNLTTDYYAGPTNVPVYYNPAVFEFVAGSVVGTKIFGETATDVQFHNDAATGCLKVAFIPNTADGTAAAKVMNGTLFTFQLKAIADGTSDIGLKADDQKTATNIGGTLYCGAYGSSAITANPDTVGQTFTINNTTATVGSAVVNTLVVKDTFDFAEDVIIDKEVINVYLDWYGDDYADAEDAGFTGLVYGVEVFDYFLGDALTTTLGDEYLRITQTEAADGFDSTGTLIEVLDTDGVTVLETYYFVYFGDITCDGLIDPDDVSICVDYVNGNIKFNSIAQFIASDYTVDTFTDPDDTSALVAVINGESSVAQGEAAAAFYAAYQSQP